MRDLREGLWHWQAPHPDWTPDETWPQHVSSYAVDDGERLLLFDPLAVPERLLQIARRRDPVIVLTAPWHERDTRTLVERLGAAVYAPRPDSARSRWPSGCAPASRASGSWSACGRWSRCRWSWWCRRTASRRIGRRSSERSREGGGAVDLQVQFGRT